MEGWKDGQMDRRLNDGGQMSKPRMTDDVDDGWTIDAFTLIFFKV